MKKISLLILFAILTGNVFASSKDNAQQLMSKLKKRLLEVSSETNISFKIRDEILDDKNDEVVLAATVDDGGMFSITLCGENSDDKQLEGICPIILSPKAHIMMNCYDLKFKTK